MACPRRKVRKSAVGWQRNARNDSRESRTNKYSTLKIFVHDDTPTSPVLNEIAILKGLQNCPHEHGGSVIARLANDAFEVDGPTGRHHCIAQKPQGCSLWTLQHMFPDGRLPKEFVANAVRCMLGCINWLYLDCDLIHTGERGCSD